MVSVYQAIFNPYKVPNPFVYALIDEIEEKYDDIKWGWGAEKFWTNRIFRYDIVLFQWPEALLTWCGDKKHTIDEYRKRIKDIKASGIKIISFVHNIEPHYSIDIKEQLCYDIIYSAADILLHMGKYSKEILEKKYPNAEHINMGSHFVYDKVYKNQYSREEGLSVLGFDSKYKYVLAFGAFRDDEERELITNLSQDIKRIDKDVMILAPSLMELPLPKCKFDIRPRLFKFRLKHRNHIICNGGTFNTVSDDILPYYYAVADVCFIQRKKILNSGNVPMGFLMNKVVVGPDIGNVGEILRKMENPVFDVTNRQNITDSVIKGLELAQKGKGNWNHNYAMENFSTAIFSSNLHDVLTKSI